MIKELIKLANHLDSKGFIKEANYLDRIIESKIKLIKQKYDGNTVDKIFISTNINRRDEKEGSFIITIHFSSGRYEVWTQRFPVYVYPEPGFDPPKQIEGRGTPFEKDLMAAYKANKVTFTDKNSRVKVVDFIKKVKEKFPNIKIQTSSIHPPFKPQMFGL